MDASVTPVSARRIEPEVFGGRELGQTAWSVIFVADRSTVTSCGEDRGERLESRVIEISAQRDRGEGQQRGLLRLEAERAGKFLGKPGHRRLERVVRSDGMGRLGAFRRLRGSDRSELGNRLLDRGGHSNSVSDFFGSAPLSIHHLRTATSGSSMSGFPSGGMWSSSSSDAVRCGRRCCFPPIFRVRGRDLPCRP